MALTPCNNKCKLDSTKMYCISCYRTKIEIGEWRTYSDDEKQFIIDRCKLKKLSISGSTNLNSEKYDES